MWIISSFVKASSVIRSCQLLSFTLNRCTASNEKTFPLVLIATMCENCTSAEISRPHYVLCSRQDSVTTCARTHLIENLLQNGTFILIIGILMELQRDKIPETHWSACDWICLELVDVWHNVGHFVYRSIRSCNRILKVCERQGTAVKREALNRRCSSFLETCNDDTMINISKVQI